MNAEDLIEAVRKLTGSVSMLRIEHAGDSLRVVAVVTTHYCGVYPSRVWTDELKLTVAKELKPSIETVRDRIVSLARHISDARRSSIYND